MSVLSSDHAALRPLGFAWLALLGLTALSLGLGIHWHGQGGLPLIVAGILWLKGWLVVRYFLEVGSVHPFIRRVLLAFIAITPLCLALTTLFAAQFARWASL